MMPGMTGLELIEHLSAAGHKPRYTMMVSAYEIPNQDNIVTIDKYLVKPVKAPIMLQAVYEALATLSTA